MVFMRPLRQGVLLGMLVLPALAAPAGSERPLRLAFSPYAPWKVLGPTGLPAGPYVEIIRALAKRMGLPLTFRDCPLQRCLLEAEGGDVDLVIGVRGTPERRAYLHFLEPAFAPASPIRFYQRLEDRRVLRSLTDLNGLSVGWTEGVQFPPPLHQHAGLIRDLSPTTASSFRKLLMARVDVVPTTEGRGRALLRQAEFAGRIRLAPLVVWPGEDRKIGLARQSPYYSLRPRFEQAIAAMVADGTMRRLLAEGPESRSASEPATGTASGQAGRCTACPPPKPAVDAPPARH